MPNARQTTGNQRLPQQSVTTPDNPTADATTGFAPATEPGRSRHGQGAPSGDGDGPASAGMADPFDPNGIRTVPATHAWSAGSEVATHESHGAASSLGNVSASGRPTEAAEAPRLDGDAFPSGATGDDSDGESDPSDGEGSDRGSLSNKEESSRGSLSAQGEALGDDPAAQAQKEVQRKKDKTKRRMLMHLALQAMPILGPFLAIVLAVVLLASCIESLLPGSESDGRGGTESAQSANPTASGARSSTGAVTRRGSTSSSPQVDVDRKGLAAMFADEGTASEGKEDGDEEGQSDGELSDKQKRVIEACKTTPSPGAGWCAAWVGDVFGNANVGVTFRGDARDWWHAFCDPSKAPASCEAGTVKTDSSRSKLKPAMIIAVASSSSGTSAGATYGHIGIYIGGGQVMHNIGAIATCSVDEWINTYGQHADVGWGWADGIKLGDGEGGGGGDAGTVGDGLGIKISSQKDIKKWAKLIDAFLEGRPLAGQGQKFAEAAAKYGIDPRLSPSMSVIESGGGQILCAPYNAWGVTASGTPGNWASYDSWDDAIDKHAKLVSGSPYHIPFTREDAATYCSESYWDGDPSFCLKTFAEKCGRGERA